MSKGYVYILSNPAMPGLLKIGRSTHGGRQRANQMYQTGVPQPFQLEFEVFVSDCSEVEALVHERLQDFRESESREFFRVDAYDATVAILKVVAGSFDHRVENADMASAIDDLIFHAAKLNEHPIIVCSAVGFISDFSMRDAVSKYHKWAAKRAAEYEASAK